MSEQHWNTQNIVDLIKSKHPTFNISVSGPGGDVDTDNIEVSANGGEAIICGYNYD